MPMKPVRRPAGNSGQPAIIVGGALIALLVNYRSYLVDFNLVPGDRGDTRLLVYILEHWFRVVRGLEPFQRLQMFFPDPNALGYADGLLLFGLPYSAFRATGLDYFTSYQLMLAVLTLVGYFGWVWLLRRALNFSPGPAVLGGILLSSFNALQAQADIGQMKGVNLYAPLIGLLWLWAGTQKPGTLLGFMSVCGFSLLLGLLFLTSYYPAWFFLFALVIFGVLQVAAAVLARGPRRYLERSILFVRARRLELLAAIGVLGIALVPFAIVYGPVVQSGQARGFDLVQDFAPTIRDVINVSGLNYAWSPMLQLLGFDFGNREVQTGTPLAVLLVATVATIASIARVHRSGWDQAKAHERLLLVLAATAAVLVVLSLRINGFSLWYAVYRFVPGASAIRALGRILMIVDMVIIVVAVQGLDELHRRLAATHRTRAVLVNTGIAILAVLLIGEEVNGMTFRLDKAVQLSFMNRLAAPPGECTAFFVYEATSDDLPSGYHQLDAMMISMKLGLPTVNGYSGLEPDEAFTLIPRSLEYPYRVLGWLLKHGATEGICELNLVDGSFRPVDVRNEYGGTQQRFRMELLSDFSTLHAAITRFLLEGNSPSNIYPQYLEENGFLDPNFGYQTGSRYRWLQDRFWIGDKGCGNRTCFGIAVTGEFGDLQLILARYGPQARVILFPNPQVLESGSMRPEDERGELLMLFPADAPGD